MSGIPAAVVCDATFQRPFHVRTLNRYACQSLGGEADVYGIAKSNLALFIGTLTGDFEGRTLVFLDLEVLRLNTLVGVVFCLDGCPDVEIAWQTVFRNHEIDISGSPFVGLYILCLDDLIVGIVEEDGHVGKRYHIGFLTVALIGNHTYMRGLSRTIDRTVDEYVQTGSGGWSLMDIETANTDFVRAVVGLKHRRSIVVLACFSGEGTFTLVVTLQCLFFIIVTPDTDARSLYGTPCHSIDYGENMFTSRQTEVGETNGRQTHLFRLAHTFAFHNHDIVIGR